MVSKTRLQIRCMREHLLYDLNPGTVDFIIVHSTVTDIIPSMFPDRFRLINETVKIFILSLPEWVCRNLLEEVMCTEGINDVSKFIENESADALCDIFIEVDTRWKPMKKAMMYSFFVVSLLEEHNRAHLLGMLVLVILDDGQKKIDKDKTKQLVERLKSELAIDCTKDDHYEKKYGPGCP